MLHAICFTCMSALVFIQASGLTFKKEVLVWTSNIYRYGYNYK